MPAEPPVARVGLPARGGRVAPDERPVDVEAQAGGTERARGQVPAAVVVGLRARDHLRGPVVGAPDELAPIGHVEVAIERPTRAGRPVGEAGELAPAARRGPEPQLDADGVRARDRDRARDAAGGRGGGARGGVGEDVDGAAAVARPDQVPPPVVVEVGGGEADERPRRRQVDPGAQAAAPVAAQHGGVARGPVAGNRDVESIVAVEIGDGHAVPGVGQRGARRRPEGPGSGVEQDRHRLARHVVGHEVGGAIAV